MKCLKKDEKVHTMNDSEKGQILKKKKKITEENKNLFLILKATKCFFHTKTNILLHENIIGNMIITLYSSI